jgi:hypothetical protein
MRRHEDSCLLPLWELSPSIGLHNLLSTSPHVFVVCHLSAEGSNTGRDAVEQPGDDERDGDCGHAVISQGPIVTYSAGPFHLSRASAALPSERG